MNRDYAVVMAVVTIGGLAIQQTLQMLDPFVMRYIAGMKQRSRSNVLPGEMNDTDYKRSVMTVLAFALALIIVEWTGIRTLKHLTLVTGFRNLGDGGDLLVTALALSAGTDGANTLLKFFGYVKDARKPEPGVAVSIFPATVSIAAGSMLDFQAVVANGSPDVTWSVVEASSGATITEKDGHYTAPNVSGTYHVACVSATDPSRPTYATVTVT